MIQFDDDEEKYFAWLRSHSSGFVLNVRKVHDPDYIVLHRASCGMILSSKHVDGAYTERSFNKWCADDIDSLRNAAKREGRADGSFSKRCGLCRP